jgi:hypothetical protein
VRDSDFLSIVCGIAYAGHCLDHQTHRADHCASGTRDRFQSHQHETELIAEWKVPLVAHILIEERQDDREVQDDELFILFDRQPRGEVEGIRQAEEAGEGLRREVEEKARVASFDSMRFNNKRYSLESG